MNDLVEYTPSVRENHVHDLNMNDVGFELALWDLLGLQEYEKLRALSYLAQMLY
jgi:Rho family protein